MLIAALIIITSLVGINFLLLHFSCNKTDKSVKNDKQPIVLHSTPSHTNEAARLAPTGS
jgi:hypothetical protein